MGLGKQLGKCTIYQIPSNTSSCHLVWNPFTANLLLTMAEMHRFKDAIYLLLENLLLREIKDRRIILDAVKAISSSFEFPQFDIMNSFHLLLPSSLLPFLLHLLDRYRGKSIFYTYKDIKLWTYKSLHL